MSIVVFRVSIVVFRVSFVAFYRVSFVATPCFNRGQAVVKGLSSPHMDHGGASREQVLSVIRNRITLIMIAFMRMRVQLHAAVSIAIVNTRPAVRAQTYILYKICIIMRVILLLLLRVRIYSCICHIAIGVNILVGVTGVNILVGVTGKG